MDEQKRKIYKSEKKKSNLLENRKECRKTQKKRVNNNGNIFRITK